MQKLPRYTNLKHFHEQECVARGAQKIGPLNSQPVKNMLTYYCFEGSPIPKVEKHPSNPIIMPAGSDKLADIGEPEGAG